MSKPPPSAADGLPARSGRPVAPWFGIVAVLETVSLMVLLVNLATAHDHGVAALIGPAHGCLYLAGVVLAWRSTRSINIRALSVIPTFGAIVAWRIASHQDPAQRRAEDPARPVNQPQGEPHDRTS